MTAEAGEFFQLPNPTGQEVALAAVMPLVHAVKRADGDVSALPSEIELQQPHRRIGWRQFSALLDEAAQHYSNSELEAIGACGLHAERYRLKVWLARKFLTVEDAYRLLVYPHPKTDYDCIQAAVDTEPGRVRIIALLQDGYPANQTFFRIMLGAAKALPQLYGIEQASVTGEVSERYLRYEIRFPASSTISARARRWLSQRIRTAYCSWNLGNAYKQLVVRTFALEQAIRAQHKLQRQLIAERAAMERRMQGITQVVVEYDHLNQVAYLSPNAERVFGYPNRVLLSEPFCILRSQDRPLAEAFFRNPQNVPDGVYPMQGIHAQGHSLNLEVAVNHFADAQGLARWTATFRDVTQRDLKPLATDVLVPAQSPETGVAHAERRDETESAAQVLLFADDDEMTRRVARQILDRAGYTVDCVVDGAQALSRLPQIKADAIVLDLNMPEMSGDRVYEQLLAEGSKLPVLFVSGDPDSIHNRFPEVPVVSKPFRAAELLGAIQGALAR